MKFENTAVNPQNYELAPQISEKIPVLPSSLKINSHSPQIPKIPGTPLKKIKGSNKFSAQFIKLISHYKKIGFNNYVLQQTACLVVNPITVGNFAFLFNCTPVGRTSDSMTVPNC